MDPERMHDNQIVNKSKRTQCIVCFEAAFILLLIAIGVWELTIYSQAVTGYLLLVGSFCLFCLFLMFSLGLKYNCAPLLVCHSCCAGLLCTILFILTMMEILMNHTTEHLSLSFRVSSTCVMATSIILIVLLASFAASSYNKAKEIWCFEAARMEYIKHLVDRALSAAISVN